MMLNIASYRMIGSPLMLEVPHLEKGRAKAKARTRETVKAMTVPRALGERDNPLPLPAGTWSSTTSVGCRF